MEKQVEKTKMAYKEEKKTLKPLAIKWFKLGYSKCSIAKMLCRDEKCIRVWLNEDKIKKQKEIEKKEKDNHMNKLKTVIKLIDQGKPNKDICEALGVESSYVNKIRNNLKK